MGASPAFLAVTQRSMAGTLVVSQEMGRQRKVTVGAGSQLNNGGSTEMAFYGPSIEPAG